MKSARIRTGGKGRKPKKTYSVVYLHCRRFPKESMLWETSAENPEVVMHLFVNDPRFNDMFVAAIFEGSANKIYGTLCPGQSSK